MPYIAYKLMHFLGIFMLLVAVTATGVHVLRGGTRKDHAERRLLSATHGVAMVLILTGGFGMLARLGIVQGGLPGWVLVKLGLWLFFGASPWLAYRGAGFARAVLVGLPLMGVLAAAIALYKPL